MERRAGIRTDVGGGSRTRALGREAIPASATGETVRNQHGQDGLATEPHGGASDASQTRRYEIRWLSWGHQAWQRLDALDSDLGNLALEAALVHLRVLL
jgi:hypothetical protein